MCQNFLPPATSVCRRTCNSFFTSYRNNTVATYAPLRKTTDNTIFMPPFISNRSEAEVRLVFLNAFEHRTRPGWWEINITTEVNARVRATLVTSLLPLILRKLVTPYGVIVVRVSTSRRRDTSTAIYPATSAETPPQIKAHKKRPKTAYKYSYKKGIAIGLWSLLIFRLKKKPSLHLESYLGTPALGGYKDGLVLFDPMTHTRTGGSGIEDFGLEGIQSLLNDHICGDVCRRFDLDKTAPLVLDSDVREEGDDDDDPDPLTPGYEPVNLLEEVNDEQ
ncbi:hypothetical protein K438DRAFT_1775408 [Mycena galopus ATCC 62051]|nr:hypothetical protein K438DRAFT_1775408 [Mycena galopus ATCC 62051]